MSLSHGQSKLSPDLAWSLFLLLKFKLLIDNFMKNRPEGVPKSQNYCFTFGNNYILYMVTKSGISPQWTLGSL